MSILDNLKLRVAIPLVAAIPLSLALVFGGAKINLGWQDYQKTVDLQDIVSLSATMSALVHEQQKERGLTAGFIASKGTQLEAELKAQREHTNDALATFKVSARAVGIASIDPSFVLRVEKILNDSSTMPDMREAVDGLNLPLGEALGFYTGLNTQHLNTIASIAEIAAEPEIVTQIVTYSNFLKSKERAGIERAVGSAGFAAGEFPPSRKSRFEGLIIEQNAYLDVFKSHASQDQIARYEALAKSPIYMDVQKLRDIALRHEGGLEGITAKQWFGTITKKINGLKQFEDGLTDDLADLMNNVRSAALDSLLLVSAILGAAVIGVVSLVWLIVRSMTRALREIMGVMGQLSSGQLNVTIPEETSNEIGNMARALKVFRQNALDVIAMNDAQIERDKQAKEDQRKQALDVADRFEARVGPMIDNVVGAVDSLSETISVLAKSSSQTKEDSATVAAAAEQSTVSVEGISQSMTELSATVAEVNSQIGNVSKVSDDAVSKTDESDQRVQELNVQAEGIEQIVSLIRDIAEQTNLLALNATIEAARAGEAGRGFAVVASEVKALAAQTSNATEEIGNRISLIQETTGRTVESILSIREVITEINSSAGVVASAATEQSATVDDIANRLHEVSQGSSTVSISSQTLSQAADIAGDASIKIETASKDLVEQSQGLKAQVRNFLSEIRSAA